MLNRNRASRLFSFVALAGAAVSFLSPRPAHAEPDFKPEPASTSRVLSVTFPDGTFRLGNTEPLAELHTQLKNVAKESGFTLGQTETLLWGGPGHNEARNTEKKNALVAALKKSGFNYEVAGEKKEEKGLLTLFIAGHPTTKQAVLGAWVASDSFLLMEWGSISRAGDGKEAAPAMPTAPVAPAAPAKPARPAAASPGGGPLQGRWTVTSISGTTYFDKNTGAYLGSGTGGSQSYTFLPDGRYKLFNYIKTRSYGWETEALTWEEGTATVEGDRVILRPTGGKYQVKDNQVAKNNYERPMTGEELKKNAKTFVWSLGQDSRTGKPALMLGSEKSKQVQYTRVED